MTLSRTHKKYLLIVSSLLLGVAIVWLVVSSLGASVSFFMTPTQIKTSVLLPYQRLRLGGLVAQDSIKPIAGGAVTFVVTDNVASVSVIYRGILPDLFREGQGVVAEGTWQDGMLIASTILAKHDEKYIPKEVMDSLKQQGYYRPTQ